MPNSNTVIHGDVVIDAKTPASVVRIWEETVAAAENVEIRGNLFLMAGAKAAPAKPKTPKPRGRS